jgi:hypothetical protein
MGPHELVPKQQDKDQAGSRTGLADNEVVGAQYIVNTTKLTDVLHHAQVQKHSRRRAIRPRSRLRRLLAAADDWLGKLSRMAQRAQAPRASRPAANGQGAGRPPYWTAHPV